MLSIQHKIDVVLAFAEFILKSGWQTFTAIVMHVIKAKEYRVLLVQKELLLMDKTGKALLRMVLKAGCE